MQIKCLSLGYISLPNLSETLTPIKMLTAGSAQASIFPWKDFRNFVC